MGRRKPTFREILKKVAERNETAAVDIFLRGLLGVIGLVGLIYVIVFSEANDKIAGLVLLMFPVLPVVYGVIDDFKQAIREISYYSGFEEEIIS